MQSHNLQPASGRIDCWAYPRFVRDFPTTDRSDKSVLSFHDHDALFIEGMSLRISMRRYAEADMDDPIGEFGKNRSPVGFHQFFDDRQSDAGPAVMPGA